MGPAYTSLSLSLCPPVSLMPSLSPSPGGSAGALTADSPQCCFVNAPGIRLRCADSVFSRSLCEPSDEKDRVFPIRPGTA